MKLTDTRSSILSSHTPANLPAHRIAKLRAGIAIALIALTLLVGFGRPAETSAYKSDSFVCTTLESGFIYAGDMYTAAQRAGNTKAENQWAQISLALQHVYISLNCSYSEGPAD